MRRSLIRSAGLIAVPLLGLALLVSALIGAGSKAGGRPAAAPVPTAAQRVATLCRRVLLVDAEGVRRGRRGRQHDRGLCRRHQGQPQLRGSR